MALAKVGPWPKTAINDFSDARNARTQPAIWQPIGTSDLPTTTDIATRAAVITGDLAYDTTANDLVVFDGSNWVAVGATFGAFSSTTAGSGIDLTGQTAGFRVYADDGGVGTTTGNRRAIASRLLLTIDSAVGVSYRSIIGQLKLVAGVDFSSANSVLAGTMGYLELAGAHTFAGFVSAGEFTVEAGGVITVSSGGVVCGVSALLNFTGAHSWTETGFAAAFYAGVAGDNEAATRRWPVALHLSGCDAVIRAETASGYEDGMKIADGVAGDTGSEGTVGFDALMKCLIGGTAYYIALFDADSVTGE